MEKRGQVTAFIIIGLVILILVGGFIAVRQGYFNAALEKLGLVRVQPVQIKSLEGFLQSCIEQVSKDGINLISLQGGYVDLPIDDIPTSTFTPLQSNLQIISGSDLRTAVWFRESGNGIQKLNVPSQKDIENELSKYVSRRFSLCLNNLTSFANQGFNFEANAVPKTDVQLQDNKILVTVDYPIKVTKDASQFSLQKYSATVNSNLGEMYNTAKYIITKENTDTFLENRTLDALVAYDEEVPYAGIDLGCSEKIWYKPEVILKLKNILYENTAAITVKNSKADTSDKLKYLQFDALQSARKDLDINFMYIPNWPTVVEINPSEGNILRNNPIGKRAGAGVQAIVSAFTCIGDHRFVYDIKYPVLITLRDNSGLIFQFATEVIIDNNMPRINTAEILNTPDIESPICNYPQKKLAILTGTFDDNGELKPLTDVDVNFNCFPATCPLGNSRNDVKGASVLVTKVPLCINGVIQGNKEGYFPGKVIMSTNDDVNNQVLLTLEPKYKKKVKVFVIEKNTGTVREPYDTEQISFQFLHKNLDFTANLNYPEDSNVELLNGDYKINSYVVRNSTWSITTKKQELENCIDTRASGLLGFFKTNTQCTKTTIDPIELDYVMTGGAKFDYSFARKDLASDGTLNLYVLTDSIPADLEGMQNIQLAVETNSENKLFKYPEVTSA